MPRDQSRRDRAPAIFSPLTRDALSSDGERVIRIVEARAADEAVRLLKAC